MIFSDRGKRWRLPRLLGLIAVLAWASAIGTGIDRIWRYESMPGLTVESPKSWPASDVIPRPRGRPTLIMFVHPRCPCSHASLAELREIMAQAGDRVDAWVLLLRPQGVGERWERTSTWEAAQSIAHVAVATDRDGSEAARFGATTSGHTVLYGADGALEFAGGITGARGHVGDNSGRARVLALLQTGLKGQYDHPVYGCPIHDPVVRKI